MIAVKAIAVHPPAINLMAFREVDFLALAPGPHPQRELTLTLSRGVAWPRLSVAAGALALALGPHPQRELTLTLSHGVAWPRLSVAAGALALALGPPSFLH